MTCHGRASQVILLRMYLYETSSASPVSSSILSSGPIELSTRGRGTDPGQLRTSDDRKGGVMRPRRTIVCWSGCCRIGAKGREAGQGSRSRSRASFCTYTCTCRDPTATEGTIQYGTGTSLAGRKGPSTPSPTALPLPRSIRLVINFCFYSPHLSSLLRLLS